MLSNISGVKPCFNKEKSQDDDFLASLQETTAKEIKNQENESLKSNALNVEELFERSSYFETKLKWINIIGITALHIVALYVLLTFPYLEKKRTFLFAYFMGAVNSFGIAGGVHRFWSHRAFKAKWPLRVILLYCFYSTGQNSLYDWVRDHRVHHKYSETEADPHDSSRGFFFSHFGWLMMKKHPEVIRRGRQVDMSDIVSDPVVAFGEKYFLPLKIICCFIIPTIIPVYLWNEDWYYSFSAQLGRFVFVLNGTFSVNSFAHMWGTRPYDKKIAPTENTFVAVVTFGEGWHNYHHAFPSDYKGAEFGKYGLYFITPLIHLFAKIGWAYDLKQPSKELIRAVMDKRGDRSYSNEKPKLRFFSK
ncbi:acyl-CoA Delta(11) desaturase-like [Belonocnema kinseyi]|uniref:acyl-CoA Delta(11) desaturase-like n=1 Tax=Belonocnema kinseyi TaxID=2817044 RepID=UPI00143D2A46|nr:acyl-CoA Delta(11) desaturase-like [Belonocnema kinseyi]